MPELKAKKIRKMSLAEREKKIQELKTAISKARASNIGAGQQENKGKIKSHRRIIARIHTVNREESLLSDKPKK